jgi:hypothetical protein
MPFPNTGAASPVSCFATGAASLTSPASLSFFSLLRSGGSRKKRGICFCGEERQPPACRFGFYRPIFYSICFLFPYVKIHHYLDPIWFLNVQVSYMVRVYFLLDPIVSSPDPKRERFVNGR